MVARQKLPNVTPITEPDESVFSIEESETNVFGVQNLMFTNFDSYSMFSERETVSSVNKLKIFFEYADFGSPSLVNAVKKLVDVVVKSETHLHTLVSDNDYQGLVVILDDLIDLVKENEGHILAPLMEFIGRVIEIYEDEHLPELTEI
ncbi:MAG: hypothetical protein OXD54_07265 [Candidatus Poribacteria bacterium]|nr:hypothetical protein [Candidatus Poribacteria bacterium]